MKNLVVSVAVLFAVGAFAQEGSKAAAQKAEPKAKTAEVKHQAEKKTEETKPAVEQARTAGEQAATGVAHKKETMHKTGEKAVRQGEAMTSEAKEAKHPAEPKKAAKKAAAKADEVKKEEPKM